MKYPWFTLFVIVLILCGLLCGCFPFDIPRGRYDLGLEINLGTNLPEGGEVLYKLFAPMGKDAMEYAAIQYREGSSITEHFQWKPMDGKAWAEVERLIESMELYISRNEGEEPIPSDCKPSQDMLYTTVPDKPTLANPYVYFVFSPQELRVYVLINLT